MTDGSPLTVHIGRLRVRGVNQAQAVALASALRESLAQRLAADPGALGAAGADRLRLTLPAAQVQGPAALGRAAGVGIAAALVAGRGGL